MSELEQLRDENRRLREALEWIRDAETHFYTEDTGTGAMRLPDLLRNWTGPLRSIFDTSRQALAQPAPAPAPQPDDDPAGPVELDTMNFTGEPPMAR